ncbi:FAD-dependent oxidoreductase [Streptomyces sp. NPDC048442]|uniref:FAD-dependent oxidoreductase n=1 Tax=Streptomyces sp. NPDC048442 TaxID=3154823 RepID=UPI00342311CD
MESAEGRAGHDGGLARHDGEFQVVVAGAGPVGLMVACELRTAGTSVVVLERNTEPERVTKAGSIGPLAVEALERRGLGEELRTAEQETLQGYLRMAEVAGLDPEKAVPKEHFAGIEKLERPGSADEGRRRMRVEQPVLVDILRRRAERLGVVVRPGHEVSGVEQDEQAVVVTAHTSAGPRRVRGQYLVGCDGGNSAVRTLTGFKFTGTAPTVTGRQGVVEIDDWGQVPHGFHYTPRGLMVHGLGVNRVAAIEFDGPPDPGAPPLTAAELQESLRRIGGLNVSITHMATGGRFSDLAHQATEYRRGRVLLAGDAAHIHAPFGGQGLNVGLTDAVNLGWKLAAVLDGWAPAGLLDTYTAERHRIGAELLENTRAQTALMRPDPHSTALRGLLEELLDLDEVKRYVVGMLAGFGVRYDLGDAHPLVGTLCPTMKLDPMGPGEPALASLADVTADGRGVLLDLGGCDDVVRTGARWSSRVRTVSAKADRDDVDALLMRPDGCVAWALPRGAHFDPGTLTVALATWFGQDPGV